MRPDHKKALEICIRKKRNITEYDLCSIYVTMQSRKNVLRYFVQRGFLELDMTGGWKINPLTYDIALKEVYNIADYTQTILQ